MKRYAILLLIIAVMLFGGCQPKDTTGELQEPLFLASVAAREGNTVTVIPLEGEEENKGTNTPITFTVAEDSTVVISDVVKVAYDGQIMETYPAQINATACVKLNEPVSAPYPGEWLNKESATYYGDAVEENHLIITAIYSDCFFAQNVIPLGCSYKINGELSDEWCVGDQVCVTYRGNYFDDANSLAEAELVCVEESDFQPDPNACYKPVIYLYPETETDVDVALTLDGELTCTYPAYGDGWHVTAAPDGTLTDERGQTYNYLYWEGETHAAFDMSHGFCIKGDDTAAFLETALADLGLTRREANEFIVYWLPLMEQNPYNLIAFQTDAYTDAAKLDISPAPDTLIRVFMTFKGVDEFVDIAPQTLSAPDRVGFTAVEWGGTEIE